MALKCFCLLLMKQEHDGIRSQTRRHPVKQGYSRKHVHAVHAVQSNTVEMPFKLLSAGSGTGGSAAVLQVMGLEDRDNQKPCSRMKPLQHVYQPVQRPSKSLIFFWALS